MANFAAAALDVQGGEITQAGGSAGGQSIRLLILPAVAKSGAYSDLIEKPDMNNRQGFAAVAFSGVYTDLGGIPNAGDPQGFSTVAFSGSYVDLLNKPILANVAYSGSYNDLTNKPYAVPNPPSGGTYVLSNGGWIGTTPCPPV